MKTEPLSLFLKKYGFDFKSIKQIASGSKYTAVLLNNGKIGVCANLGTVVDSSISIYSKLDLSSPPHRIVFNAYLNACCNYKVDYSKDLDIWESINFYNYERIIMLGYFKPLVNKFNAAGITLSIFDITKKDNILVPIEEKEDFIKSADCIILTSTSISNGTFLESISDSKDGCDIFLLGPSSNMSSEIFNYRNIKGICGSTFSNNDERVLEIIKKNGGTRQFLKIGEKHCILH